ncbi:MAG: 30S ribosomal protein S4 [Verrucomicrobiota bacterium]|nr:30S ribosomal protein S4 [Verrucomicrobiota bacterium]
MKPQAKHKYCRRLGYCLWGMAKCPSNKRPYSPGAQGKNKRRRKQSTYGELLQEKQILRRYYAISEKQMKNAYIKAKKVKGVVGDILLSHLECRLDSVVYHAGLVPSIFSAKQVVSHRHILVNGKIVDRCSYLVSPGDKISIKDEKSPAIADQARKTDKEIPPYLEVDEEKLIATLTRQPLAEEISLNVDVTKVVEYYAR